MGKQFNEFAEIYDELFSAAMDYEKEVRFYDKILKEDNCKKILEVGCGTGNRGSLFIDKGYVYTGLDISEGMLKIARQKYPDVDFIRGDARKLTLKQNYDAILFLGMGSAYLTTDKEALSALKSMKKQVKHGLIIIDVFDADVIIPNFKKKISWSKQIGTKTITRRSVNQLNPLYHNSWDRQLTYIVKENGTNQQKYIDKARLRAFSSNDFRRLFSRAGINDTQIIQNGDVLIAIGRI